MRAYDVIRWAPASAFESWKIITPVPSDKVEGESLSTTTICAYLLPTTRLFTGSAVT